MVATTRTKLGEERVGKEGLFRKCDECVCMSEKVGDIPLFIWTKAYAK